MSLAALLQLARPLILASRSPRRAELLRLLGLRFQIFPPPREEPDTDGRPPHEYVLHLACQKAHAVAQHLTRPCVILAADTTVVLESAVLNKPRTAEEASAMLWRLSGRTHEVYTGVALLSLPEQRLLTAYARTEVTFRPLKPEEIAAYVATGLPLDKAGAYGIQDPFGAVFVESIRGCYYNVVGLPLQLVYQLLEQVCHEL